MNNNIIAKSSIIIDASKDQIWDALTNPKSIKEYMFGTNVISDWKEGSKITWQGEWQGKKYEDKGEILQFKPGEILQYTHFSPLEGLSDSEENYHTVTVRLSEEKTGVYVSLIQDNNPTEKAREHSEKMWNMMLDALKKFVEK